MQRVSLNKLNPGMVLEDNVRDQKGRVLFQAGQVLSDKHIRVFKIWGVNEVWIKAEEHQDSSWENEAPIPKEIYDQAQNIVQKRFKNNSREDPFINELFYLCLERKAKELYWNPFKLEKISFDRSSCFDHDIQDNNLNRRRKITIDNLVNDRLKLATLPNIYYRTMEAIHDPSMSLADIAEIVSKDPSLSVKILQLVNSSFYSLLKRVETLTHALALLGTNHLMTIVTGVSVASIFKQISSNILNMNLFWQHSIGCGIVARLISSFLPGVVNSERYFVAGILHDIGRLIMVQTIPKEMKSILTMERNNDVPLFKVETKNLGFDHTQVGAYLTQKWNLPNSLEKMIRYHHQPEQVDQYLDPSIVYIANFIVTALEIGSTGDAVLPPFKSEVWEKLSLKESILELIFVQLDHQLKDTFELIYGTN